MIPATKPISEAIRLLELHSTGLLDSAPEPEFDTIVELASSICQTPIALVSLIDENRQWFKAKKGLAAQETHRDYAFCSHAILQDDLFEIEDSEADNRFAKNPLVTGEPQVKFYAGYPLTSEGGHKLGTLCVIDNKPNKLSLEQRHLLKKLSEQTMRLVRLRSLHRDALKRVKMLETITDNLSNVIWMSDPEKTKISYVSNAYEKIWEQSKETLKKNPTSFIDSVHPEDRERLKSAMPLQALGQYDEKYRLLVNGKTKWIHDRAFPIKDQSGTITQIVGIATEITNEVLREKSILDEKERFETIVNNIPIMLTYFDESEKFEWSNREMERVLGWGVKEFVQGDMLKYLLPRAEDQDRAMRFMKSGSKDWMDFLITTKEGSELETSWANVQLSSGKSIGIGKNVHLEKQQQKIIQEQQVKILNSAKLSTLGEMAGGIAHEINNPLSVILGRAGNLRKNIANNKIDPAEITKGLESIENTALRIAKIVKGLRTFSRSGDKDPCERVSFSSLVQDALELCREKFRMKNILITVSHKEEFLLDCRVVQITQILVNLLNNSYDAISEQENPWITIKSSINNRMAIISLEDSGPGISEEVQKNMMLPFFTTKDVGMGTGLGLSISKSIAEDHGGNLVYDASSSHTKFDLSLPIAQL